MSQSYYAFYALVIKAMMYEFQYHALPLTDILEPVLLSFVPLITNTMVCKFKYCALPLTKILGTVL
jgi:hypothetical protein